MSETSTQKPMRIVKLVASNIKRLSAVEIVPGRNSVIISGSNDQGKSSCIDSIEYALAGGASICQKPLREGAKKGYIIADLGDIVVERTFSASGGTSLTVKTKDGVALKSPQGILDELCSKVAFDPLAFVKMKPDAQAEMLKKLVGLDFTKQDAQRKLKYDERTLVNRNLSQKEATLAGIAVVADAPESEVSMQDLVNRLNDAKRHNQTITDSRLAVEKANEEVQDLHDDIHNLKVNSEAVVKDLNRQIDELKKRITTEEADCALKIDAKNTALKQAVAFALGKSTAAASMLAMDEAAIQTEMTTIEASNNKFRQAQRRNEVADEVANLRKQAEALTTEIDQIDEFKQDQVSKAKYPIEGLSFDEVGVMLNGLPFSQGSQARQLQAAIAIGMALNPTVRVILVRDASLLDTESLAMVQKMAEEKDFQVWLECVESKDPGAIVIHDGKVFE